MDAPPALSRFELAAAELRALGIFIARLPGEYRVSFRGGPEAAAFCTDIWGSCPERG
jgi:hypothetical protein